MSAQYDIGGLHTRRIGRIHIIYRDNSADGEQKKKKQTENSYTCT